MSLHVETLTNSRWVNSESIAPACGPSHRLLFRTLSDSILAFILRCLDAERVVEVPLGSRRIMSRSLVAVKSRWAMRAVERKSSRELLSSTETSFVFSARAF